MEESPVKSDDLIEIMDSSASMDLENDKLQFNTSVTAKEAKNRYECPICFCFLQDPVLTICGHHFCKICLTNCLENNDQRCPIDNRMLSSSDVFPDNYTKREIDETLVICPNEGCLSPISAKNYEDHLENCKHKRDTFEEEVKGYDCPFRSVGCDFKITSVPLQLLKHLKTNIMQHLQFLLKEHKVLANGFRNCRDYCPHSQSCIHNAEYVNGSQPKLPFYMHDVYEKLTELDQRTTEYAIRLENIRTQWERSLSETNYTKLSHPEMKNGTLLWKVGKFDDMVVEMNKDRNYACWSPTFSTTEMGYRFRIRLTLSSKNKDDLAIFLHVVKGSYDFILRWPFNGEFTISIIHPLDPNLRFKSVIKTNNSEAFKRPVVDINQCGFGFSKTVSISDLFKQGYLQDDKLIVVVIAKSNDVD